MPELQTLIGAFLGAVFLVFVLLDIFGAPRFVLVCLIGALVAGLANYINALHPFWV